IVKVFGAELRLFERKIAVLRIFRDLLVAQPSQGTVLLAHDRPEALEARAPEGGIVDKQEIAAPKALARDRPVGFRIDRQEGAGRATGLRYAPHEHHNVPVWVGID